MSLLSQFSSVALKGLNKFRKTPKNGLSSAPVINNGQLNIVWLVHLIQIVA